MSLLRAAILAGVVFVSSSCSSTVPTESEQQTMQLGRLGGGGGGIQPMCVEGCLDPDPDPDAVGYFLPGLENQWAACADPSSDQDYDGLDDNCEFKLAFEFRPLMSFSTGDEVRREPRWAAEWLGGDPGSKTVRLAYLPSYWMDMGDGGTSHSNCETFSLFPVPGFLMSLETCGGHAGDSEWIRLDVKYNSNTKHWYVADALYSAHEWHVDFEANADSSLRSIPEATPSYSALMEYGDKVGGYPIAYVADRKHANYPTRQFCEDHGGVKSGANSGSDSCSLPRGAVRLEVSPAENIGSREYPFINCVVTQRTDHPLYGTSPQNCYWSSWSAFTGWFDTTGGGGESTAYGIQLFNWFGF